MFASPQEDEALQFLSLPQCLDSILHAEHKTVLEEMRDDFDLTLSTKNKSVGIDDFPSLRRKTVTNHESGAFMDNSIESDSIDKQQEDAIPSIFTLDLKRVMDFSLKKDKRKSKSTSVATPSRFQHAFMKLLCNAEFEELSPRDLMLTSALNTDYLLTLPVYVDWKKAYESSAIIFRRGYTTERQKGLLIAEKLDYLQSKLLQRIFFLFSKPVGRVGVWLNEVFKSTKQKQDTEIFANKLKLWIKEMPLPPKSYTYDEKMFDDLKEIDILSSDYPIWVAAQKAVTRYEGILSQVGPREKLLRKFLAWAGLLPSTPEQAFDLDSHTTSFESNLSPSFLSRISLSDIWKPASPKSCGNDLGEMLKKAFLILFFQSMLQEPAFQELILLYTEENGERDSSDQAEVPSLQMKIYERIPIPDLPVVFPHKKLSFRILDAVLRISTDMPHHRTYLSAVLLDVIPAIALVLYVSRVVLGYKQTRDRYQASSLLVNRTLYEKTVASGFGSVHFLLDASEQHLILTSVPLLFFLFESGQITKNFLHACDKSKGCRT